VLYGKGAELENGGQRCAEQGKKKKFHVRLAKQNLELREDGNGKPASKEFLALRVREINRQREKIAGPGPHGLIRTAAAIIHVKKKRYTKY